MSKKRLTMYDFGKKIMSEKELFEFKPLSITPKNVTGKPEIYSLTFLWSWNGYNGYGTIDYNCNTNKVCNEYGNNFSQIVVHSNSKKQAQKNVSELYNDQSLIQLFDMILQKTDLNSKELLNKTENSHC